MLVLAGNSKYLIFCVYIYILYICVCVCVCVRQPKEITGTVEYIRIYKSGSIYCHNPVKNDTIRVGEVALDGHQLGCPVHSVVSGCPQPLAVLFFMG